MRSFISSSLKVVCSKSKLKGVGQMGSSLISWRLDKYGWFNASSTVHREHKFQEHEWMIESIIKHKWGIPVMRLEGSKTSIFSARSIANGDTSGNLDAKGCFSTWGSCFTYFFALSLRKNPRSESSGEPSSWWIKITMRTMLNNILLIRELHSLVTGTHIVYQQSSRYKEFNLSMVRRKIPQL